MPMMLRRAPSAKDSPTLRFFFWPIAAAITPQISQKPMSAPQSITSPPTPDYVAQILPLGGSRCGGFKAPETRDIALALPGLMRGAYGGVRMQALHYGTLVSPARKRLDTITVRAYRSNTTGCRRAGPR